MNIRQPAVGGLFYPSHPQKLSGSVEGFLSAAKSQASGFAPKALVAPHAGFVYSGPVAASAYRSLESARKSFRRVIVIGPSHRMPFSGAATSGYDRFLTPLGAIELDKELTSAVETHPSVITLPEAHTHEHSLEVQLPFLQVVLGNFSLLPLVVGNIDAQQMEEIITLTWQHEDTLLVVSSDLSHYLPYEKAMIKDKNTTANICSLNPNINGDQACGCRPLNGLLKFCHDNNLTIDNIDLRNSGDTAGDKSRVVGYGAYVVH